MWNYFDTHPNGGFNNYVVYFFFVSFVKSLREGQLRKDSNRRCPDMDSQIYYWKERLQHQENHTRLL